MKLTDIYNIIAETPRTIGLKRTISYAFNYSIDLLFDIRHGTNTLSWASLDNLEIDSNNLHRGGRYAPTLSSPFRKTMNILDIPNGSVFVDLGCGKGKTLLLASEYEFKRIVGIEFAGKLCDIARNNLSVYKKKRSANQNFEVIESDVVNYIFKDDENVFFMFNPFDEVVMNRIIENISMSLERNNRKIWIIYYSPAHSIVIERQNNFMKYGDYI